MSEQMYDFKLVGRTPLLPHADNIESADSLDRWRKDSKNKNQSVKGDDRSPAWTWQTYLYHDEKHICWPGENVLACLRQAAARVIMKGQKSYKEVIAEAVFIETEFCTFLHKGKQIPWRAIQDIRDLPYKEQADFVKDTFGFTLFAKRARINQKAKHVRVRPRFETWEVTGKLLVTAQEVTPKVLAQIFEIAGRIGQGDWRPGCKTPGSFGQYSAKLKAA